jgi:Antitoxin VbhA
MAAGAAIATVTRAQQMENALASGRLEGLEPSPGANAIFQRYAAGELTLDEMGQAIDQFVDQEYGPVRLPGNDRP